jgi:hypothetical protein
MNCLILLSNVFINSRKVQFTPEQAMKAQRGVEV